MVTATEHLCGETLVQSVVLSKLAIFPLRCHPFWQI